MSGATFDSWLARVDRLVTRQYLLSYHDLPDLLDARDAFDSGMTPREFVDEEVTPMIEDELRYVA